MNGEKKKPKIIKILIPIIIIAVIVALVYFIILKPMELAKLPQAELTSIERTDLDNSVTFSGVVESNVFEQVNAQESGRILTVNVSEGDTVHKGDVLATLDKRDIENQILTQQAKIASSDTNSEYNISDAEKKYYDTLREVNDGTYSEIRNAKINLDKAQTTLDKAEKKYDNETAKQGSDKDTSLSSAKQNVTKAEQAVQTAKRSLDSAELTLESSKTLLTSSKESLQKTKRELEYCEQDLEKAKRERDEENYSSLRSYKNKVDDAKKAFDERFSDEKKDVVDDARNKYEEVLEKYSYFEVYYHSRSGITELPDADFWKDYGITGVTEKDLKKMDQVVADAKKKVKSAVKNYDENGEKAARDYEDAVVAYADAKANLDIKHTDQIETAERALERAQSSYETAKLSYENTKISYEKDKNSLKRAQDDYDSALVALDYAKQGIDSVYDANEEKEEELSVSIEDAREALRQAQEAYDIAQKNAQTTLANLKAAADKQRVLSGNDPDLIQLRILEERLDNCVVVAPCDGTVTKVNATVGSTPSGVLFIIEDTENLMMVATVKEYSTAELKAGLDADINIPSINKEYKGRISKISPTGVKGADGRTDGQANFKISADIDTGDDDSVLIGMTAKAEVIVGSADGVLAVAYDCVATEDGESHICTAEAIDPVKAPGQFKVKFVPVTMGFESNTMVEISGDGISEGMEILNNAGDYTEGQTVVILPQMPAMQ